MLRTVGNPGVGLQAGTCRALGPTLVCSSHKNLRETYPLWISRYALCGRLSGMNGVKPTAWPMREPVGTAAARGAAVRENPVLSLACGAF